MMSDGNRINPLSARIGEIVISRAPDILEALALGSCVATFIYDEVAKIGGCAHVLLPESNEYMKRLDKDDHNKPGKYADLAIPNLIKMLVQKGATRDRLKAKIAGGAKMFDLTVKSPIAMDVGERNIRAVIENLKKNDIPLVGNDTGEDYGRTVAFDLATGVMTIKLGLKKVVKHI